MRKMMTATAVLALVATSGAANGQSAKAKREANEKALKLMGLSNGTGGATGCYDPRQVTGYKRKVMERMGSAPCEVTPQRVTPTVAPPPPGPGYVTVPVSATSRRFPNGERVSLSFEAAGVGGSGTITHRAPGQPTKTVSISYMSEFVGIIAADKVRYNVSGDTDRGQQSWGCEITIDWRAAKIVTVRDLTRGGHPPCKESL